MFVDQFLQFLDVSTCLLQETRWYGMTWHWDREGMPRRILWRFAKLYKPVSRVGRTRRTTLGNILLRAAAAASALGFPPSKQSSNSNKG